MTKTILLVEDEENDVELLQYAMQQAGVTNPIQIAKDGRQAIDYLKGTGKFANRAEFPLPCLVLLDLKLPYVMGLDVLKWIRQQPHLASLVVILTSSGEAADVATAYGLGANAYLVKPPEAIKLLDMTRAIKDFWLTQNTPPPESHAQAVASVWAHPRPADLAQTHLPPVPRNQEVGQLS